MGIVKKENILYDYLNGNVKVTLFNDGTKIQEWPNEEEANPQYPNSMDIKITNYCDAGCAFCHEMSTIKGKHGDLEHLKNSIRVLPPGTELAIGGGNPLDHPDLLKFLTWCKKQQLVPNITVNSKHLIQHIHIINYLIDSKLIYGIGLSITDDFDFESLNHINKTDNVVFHVIVGVNSPKILNKINESKVKKTLILGYKELGRGKQYINQDVKNLKKEWYDTIGNYTKKVFLSFDNLAIEQLKLKRFLSEKEWKSFYMGNEGQFTMYIDAVEQKFATSSTCSKKFDLDDYIDAHFSVIRHINNFTTYE